MRPAWRNVLGVAIVSALVVATAGAAVFNGTVYYTRSGVTPNVMSVTYSYDDSTNILTLGLPATAITTLPAADGILLAPNGDLLVTGGFNGDVYDVVIGSGSFTSVHPGTTGQPQTCFHMALDPGHAKFYTSDYYTSQSGPLDVVPLPFGTQGTSHAVTGDENSVTQIAFAPGTGNVFYTASTIISGGGTNCCGNVGTINLGTYVTTQLLSNVTPAHSIIYDPFTGLMTMFGGGEAGTIDQSGGSLKTSSALNADFDQGAVDGLGHAFIAGNNQLTFLDYTTSHDITNPDHIIISSDNSFVGADDVAPLIEVSSTKCPLTIGYWKNHPSAWPSACLPMLLGTTHTYTKNQLLSILGGHNTSDASVILARQLIAANLSICNGSDPTSVAATIADADSLIGTLSIPAHIKTSSVLGQKMVADAAILNNYNNGVLTPNCTP